MLIIDGDYPMALAVQANRDLTLPIVEARNAPPLDGPDSGWDDEQIMALLPECHADSIPVDTPRIEEITTTWIPSKRVGWSLGSINSVISLLSS